MFKQPSDTLKQKSTNARRAATTLRTLGESPELSHADQGVLLTAAKILEAFARQKTSQAKSAKATEVAFDKASLKATDELKRAIDAWGVSTTIDKLALSQFDTLDRDNKSIRKALNEPSQHYERDLRWLLDYRTDEARRGAIGSAAYDVAKGRTTAEAAAAQLRARYDAARADVSTQQLAARIDAILAEKAAVPA